MATKSKSVSSRSASRARRPASKSGGRAGLPAPVTSLLRFSRPRSGPEVLALGLVLTGVGSGLMTIVVALSRRQPPTVLPWPAAALLFAALGARTFPWWRRELETMTRDRARYLAGGGLLALVALALLWHGASASIGVGPAYPLPGPFQSGLPAMGALFIATILGVALILKFPMTRWLGGGLAAAGAGIASARERRMLESTSVHAIVDGTWGEALPEPAEETPGARQESTRITESRAPSLPPSVRCAPAPLPPLATFVSSPRRQAAPSDLDAKARRIEESLASFNVRARVVDYHCGPVVTQFDVQPDRGVKVKSITALQNDLALALAAPTIRIQAPVPGKPVVGIEIPNATATAVSLRELLESEAYLSAKSPLKIALGKDVSGSAAVIDLARMPHLLIAGATGSGKSVCINALISCLLYQNTPEQVRLLMVDPKTVELGVYNGVPHLYSPVITDMEKVVGVLQWALREMEGRYRKFADNTVRNIQRYNEKMEAAGLKPLPYIVIIIDELADLMMVSPEDVEEAICRLAQLARAAGIHLVIATQRPSVDVITGLIKANFPARIAFMMTSQVDSRTILDAAGAEKLLGRGDMLYMPPDAPKSTRLQGASVSEAEIEALVDFWKASPLHGSIQHVPSEEFAEAEKAAQSADDELLVEAVRVVREFQHASVSLLQRKLRIGYSRAARVMDQLEARGVVGPADGSKQRPVLEADDTQAI